MRLQNFKTIFLSVVILSFFAFMPINESFASEITYPVSSGSDTFSFRDITFLGPFPPPPEPTITVTDYINNKGGTATCSIFDFYANLDVTEKDFVNAVIIQPSSETTIVATETEISNAIFNGTFSVTDKFVAPPEDPGDDVVTICSYTFDSPDAARAKIALPLSVGGNVQFSDLEFNENELANLGIKPITGAINVELTDGATFSSVPTVKISYANAAFLPGTDKHDIQMWYKAPGQLWELITPSNQQLFFSNIFLDETAMTVTSNPAGPGFAGVDGQGAYVLAFDTGVPGGGGGGLVRPSLVVNALAGIGGGAGGGSAYSSPACQISNQVLLDWIDVPLEVEQTVVNHDSSTPASPYDLGYFEDFVDYPLIINDNGFILSGFTTTLETQTLKINTPHTIKFLCYESEIIQHFSLYTNLRDATDEIHESDTQILYNANQELRVVDPNGFFESVSLTVNELEDNKKQVDLEITFAKTMDTSHIIVRSWDPNLYSTDAHILDAWEIVSDEIIESPIITSPEPEIQELKSQSIPIWIKNNAAWWSDQQISDSDFVAGIEYLIKNKIINVPGVEVGASSVSTEIPDWIKNNAGWWADSLITDEDFTEAMQWLVANGVIQI